MTMTERNLRDLIVHWKQALLLAIALALALLLIARPCQQRSRTCEHSATLRLPRDGRSRHQVAIHQACLSL